MMKLKIFNMLFIILCMIISLCVANTNDHHEDDGELIFSHVLYRHGDRSPVATFPTDQYANISYWNVGWGQLTNWGKQQHYELGQWLRHRYGNILLPKYYSENDIYIQSTDVDRTLASAYSNLAGLYPPHDYEIWNEKLLWQPIPVHTIPNNDDYIIGGAQALCPSYNQAYAELMASPLFVKINQQSESLYDYLTEHTGLPINTSSDPLLMTLMVRDTLNCEMVHNFELPEWSNRIFPGGREIDRLALLYYVLPSYTPKLSMIKNGYFLKDVLDRSVSKYRGELSPDRKVYVYSAHDANISNLLYALKLSDNNFVQYAATLLFELRKTAAGPVMEIFYKESSTSQVARKLNIPNCGYSCPLEMMYILYNDILPTEDFNTACNH